MIIAAALSLAGHCRLDLVLEREAPEDCLHGTGLGLLHHLLQLPLLPLLPGPGLGVLGDDTHADGGRGQTEVDRRAVRPAAWQQCDGSV